MGNVGEGDGDDGHGCGAGWEVLGGQSYEGLPPEVGAFNSQKWPHAPWPVHNFAHFWLFCGNFETLGVGVI